MVLTALSNASQNVGNNEGEQSLCSGMSGEIMYETDSAGTLNGDEQG